MTPPLPPISHINLAKRFRGGERQAELLIRALANRGWRQRLVARAANPLATRCGGIDNLEVIEVPMNHWAAARALRGSRLVHVHEGRSIYPAWLANRFAGIPYVITRRIPSDKKTRRLQSSIYRQAAAITAVSNAVAQTLKTNTGIKTTRVIPDCVAEFPIQSKAISTIRRQYASKKIIGHIGELDHQHKGQNTIIQVARHAAEAYPNWHFLLLGSGRDEQVFRNAIADLNNIDLVGFVDNVGDYLSAFDLFVFPSLVEGLGSTLLDAMYFGLPVVATRVGGIPEVVVDGQNGHLIPPDDPDALARAIAALLGDPERYETIRATNRNAAAEYLPKRIAEQYEAVYDAVR